MKKIFSIVAISLSIGALTGIAANAATSANGHSYTGYGSVQNLGAGVAKIYATASNPSGTINEVRAFGKTNGISNGASSGRTYASINRQGSGAGGNEAWTGARDSKGVKNTRHAIG